MREALGCGRREGQDTTEVGNMKAVLALAVALLLSAPSGATPPSLYFDMGDGTNCVAPEPYSFIDVTLLVGSLTEDIEGVAFITLKVERTFSGVFQGWINLLGGGLPIGNPELGVDWGPPAGDCVAPNDYGVVPVALLHYFYLLEPGTIAPDPAHANAFWDCDAVVWGLNHAELPPGGIGGVGVVPPGGCTGVVPVESASWGTLKALFR
jgi:hypothetical protein